MLYALIALALGLTFAMVWSKNIIFGWASVIFWAILGGYCYTLSEATWDIYYFLFFACLFGMVILCALGMNTLRTTKEEKEVGEEMYDEGKDETQYIDEGKEEAGEKGYIDEGDNPEESEVSERTKKLRGRAKKRRKGQGGSRRL